MLMSILKLPVITRSVAAALVKPLLRLLLESLCNLSFSYMDTDRHPTDGQTDRQTGVRGGSAAMVMHSVSL